MQDDIVYDRVEDIREEDFADSIDRDEIAKRMTCTGAVDEVNGEWNANLRGPKMGYSSIGRFRDKGRAERVMELALAELNAPEEMAARIEAEVARQIASRMRIARERVELRDELIEMAREATQGTDLQEGDVILVQRTTRVDYRKSINWHVVYVDGETLCVDLDEYAMQHKNAAVEAAKENHDGRVLVAQDGKLSFARKGQKGSRAYKTRYRVYHGQRSRYGNPIAQRKAAYINDEGALVSHRYGASKEDVAEFDTEEEAEAAIIATGQDLSSQSPGYAFVVGEVKVPVRKGES